MGRLLIDIIVSSFLLSAAPVREIIQIMIAIEQELTEFHRFAQQRLAAGMNGSLQDLLDEWNAEREFERSVADIRESIRQCEAGLGLPLAEAFAEIRARLEQRG